MHHPLDRAHGVVANRIVALGGIPNELTRVGHDLSRDRVARVLGANERGQRRCKADRVALGHGLEFRKPLRLSQPRFDEILGGGQAAVLKSERGHSAFTIREEVRTLARGDAARFIGPSYGNGGDVASRGPRARSPLTEPRGDSQSGASLIQDAGWDWRPV